MSPFGVNKNGHDDLAGLLDPVRQFLRGGAGREEQSGGGSGEGIHDDVPCLSVGKGVRIAPPR